MEHLLVKAGMTSDPITVDPEATLSTCYHLTRLNGIRRLPVVDSEGRLVGIVTLGDSGVDGITTESDVFRLLVEQLPEP